MDDFGIEQRVYYENTDAGGVMFYGEYFRFYERARTEFIRHIGYNVADMMKDDDATFFVVRKVEAEYLKPIFLDDLITVTASIIEKKRSSVVFRQEIYRAGQKVAFANILCVGVSKEGKPKKIEFF